jgi:NodT family efflux transporter outer membrane factor (OMF) lipoprotein
MRKWEMKVQYKLVQRAVGLGFRARANERKRSGRGSAVAFGAALLLGACATGPVYVRPDVALSPTFKEAPQAWTVARAPETMGSEGWWHVFADPVLDGLITQLRFGNQNLAAAAARQRQSSALLRQATASLWPGVTAQADSTRQRARSASGAAAVSTSMSAGVDASWEVDLWGGLNSSVDAARATAASAEATRAATQLSLEAQLAQSYLLLQVADAQIRLLDATLHANDKALQLAQDRFAGGVAAKGDVDAAHAQLATTQAQHDDAVIGRQQLEHAIAVLIGKPPAAFALTPFAIDPTPVALATLPAAVPSALLQRRPDIAAAERSAAAANAQIGVARAALFPDLSISASAGFKSDRLSDLITAPARVWTLGPELAAVLFDGGARKAARVAAAANYDAVAATYKQTVLAALQEVEDALVQLRELEQEANSTQAAVDAAKASLDQALHQYQGGVISFLNVVTAQETLLSAQLAQLNVLGRRLTAAVALVRALGGGWSTAELSVGK